MAERAALTTARSLKGMASALPLRAYVSGALTGVEEAHARELYEAAAEALKMHGFSVYLPHQATDPVRHPDASPEDVYLRDRTEVATSDLVVAFLGRPSLGVGMELELAGAALVPILFVIPERAGISRMALGGRARTFGPITFRGLEDLKAALQLKLPEIVLELPERERTSIPDVSRALSGGRTRLGMNRTTLARKLGVSPSYVKQVEEAPALVSNPSLAFLAAASNVLGISLGALIGEPMSSSPLLVSLRDYAVSRSLSYIEYRSLERIAARGLRPERALSSGEWDAVRESEARARGGIEQPQLLPNDRTR